MDFLLILKAYDRHSLSNCFTHVIKTSYYILHNLKKKSILPFFFFFFQIKVSCTVNLQERRIWSESWTIHFCLEFWHSFVFWVPNHHTLVNRFWGIKSEQVWYTCNILATKKMVSRISLHKKYTVLAKNIKTFSLLFLHFMLHL